jgi:NAD-dependent deacetylase
VAKATGPAPAHTAIADIGNILVARGASFTVVTQNIDGLHQAAGNDPDRVYEVHGTVHWSRCWTCKDRRPMQQILDRVRAGEEDPPCEICGGILKSDTILFGQALVPEVIDAALAAADECDLLLAVGSSLSVFPAANVVPRARHAGARVVIANLEPTKMDRLADALLLGPLADTLPALARGFPTTA